MNQIYKYNYNAVNELSYLTEDFKGKITKICIYDIFHTNSSPPFLRFLLERNVFGELDFIYPFLKEEALTTHTILLFLKTFFEHYGIIFSSDVFHFDGACRLFSKGNDKGNDKNKDNEYYLFIDVSVLKLETNHLSIPMVLMDEIMNTNQMYNIKIAEEVTNFFLRNNDFIFMQDEKERNIEIPKVVYVGKLEKTLEFTFVFGNTKSLEKNNTFGPYYYFTDFENAQEQIKKMPETKKKGIVRFAIFTGKMLVLHEIKNESNNNNNNLEDWTTQYNSVQINNLESQTYIVKEYSQQIPLSYNYFL